MVEKYLYYPTGSVKSINPEYVKELLKLEGYQILTPYVSMSRKFRFKCPKGHEGRTDLNNWNKGTRCVKCGVLYKYKIDGAKSLFAEHGYILTPGQEYKDNKSVMEYTCSRGHVNTIRVFSLIAGQRCSYCKGTKSYPKDVEEWFDVRGYNLLKPYSKDSIKLQYECRKCGYVGKNAWSNVRRAKKVKCYCTGVKNA